MWKKGLAVVGTAMIIIIPTPPPRQPVHELTSPLFCIPTFGGRNVCMPADEDPGYLWGWG